MRVCKCGRQVFSIDENVPVQCSRCNFGFSRDQYLIQPDSPTKLAPLGRWPTWTILVKCCRDKEDVGIGDTVKRMADTIGGERFKRWAQQCGIPCGCTERQERWNQMYPYRGS